MFASPPFRKGSSKRIKCPTRLGLIHNKTFPKLYNILYLHPYEGKMYAENYKRLEQLIDKLREFNGVILVEGMRDEVALRKLGVETEIIKLSRFPLAEIALTASHYHDIMILTDFDRKGEDLAKKLTQYLEGYKCRVDTNTRRELKKIAKKDVKGVEDLYGLYLRVKSLRF